MPINYFEQISVAIGLGQSLLFSELTSFSLGGLVVPGYLALHLNNPYSIIFVYLTSLLAFGTIQAFKKVAIIYGKRRSSLLILLGYLYSIGLYMGAKNFYLNDFGLPIDLVGPLIPGLLAISHERQGVIPTISLSLVGAVSTRLIMILVTGGRII